MVCWSQYLQKRGEIEKVIKVETSNNNNCNPCYFITEMIGVWLMMFVDFTKWASSQLFAAWWLKVSVVDWNDWKVDWMICHRINGWWRWLECGEVADSSDGDLTKWALSQLFVGDYMIGMLLNWCIHRLEGGLDDWNVVDKVVVFNISIVLTSFIAESWWNDVTLLLDWLSLQIVSCFVPYQYLDRNNVESN